MGIWTTRTFYIITILGEKFQGDTPLRGTFFELKV